IDLTELIARERKMSVDTAGFEREMQRQRERARAAQKKEVITVADAADAAPATQFTGYEKENLTNFTTQIEALVEGADFDFVAVKQTPCYAEKGGQVGDTGSISFGGKTVEILDTKGNAGGAYLHKVAKNSVPKSAVGMDAILNVNLERRAAIQRHHSATHLLHWALRKVLGEHVRQAGSFVNEERLRFDFSHFEAPSKDQLREIERLANEKLLENIGVKWYEVPFNEKPENCLAFFGDKYGAVVRVIDMGFHAELCGGTHVSSLGEIGMIKIVSESAIASGTRRLEAVAGKAAFEYANKMESQILGITSRLSCKSGEISEHLEKLIAAKNELEKEIKNLKKQSASKEAENLVSGAIESGGVSWIVKITNAENPNELRELAVQISKSANIENLAILLGANAGGKGAVLALCSEGAIKSGVKAGDVIRKAAALMGGKGGGKPDFAMGGGDAKKLESAFAEFKNSLK
ncbi:MAG: alanine--tRNA ligase, partial [Opitutales bacterium]|nr:alanine--tRNA ligase [Opitutales bacterium]